LIVVESYNDSPGAVRGLSRGREIAGRVLKAEGRRDARIRIIYTGDRSIRRLHKEFLGRDKVTDVITFPIESGPRGRIEAEIYVNVQQAARQAAGFGASRRSEIARLIIHGVLHLTGHDDASAALRSAMSAAEDRYLAKFGKRPKRRKQ
jgi:rRNA maturation RNase YbeY